MVGTFVKGDVGCFPFVRIIQLGRALINGKGFSRITKPTERNSAYLSLHCFRLMRDCKLESLANGKEISAVPFRTEISGKLPYHLTSNQIFWPNGKVGMVDKLVTFYLGQHCNSQLCIRLFQFSGIELSRTEKGESIK